MNTLTVVFTKSKKVFPIISWLIRLWTRRPYSHVAIEGEILNWGKYYFQSSDNKSNYEHEKYFNRKHHIVKKYILPVDTLTRERIMRQCYQDSGAPYGRWQNIGIVLVDIVSWFGKDIENPWKDGKNCSENLYVNAFKNMVLGLNTYNPNTIKPHHIEDLILEEYTGKYKLIEYRS